MKKLVIKDLKLRRLLSKRKLKHFILASILTNSRLFKLIRWNAFINLKNLTQSKSKISTNNRCLYTVNRKKFNKLTSFSRLVFLNLVRNGNIHGIQKSTW